MNVNVESTPCVCGVAFQTKAQVYPLRVWSSLRPISIKDIKNNIVWTYQRIFRGYDDRAIWDLYSWISKTLVKMLHEYNVNHISVPYRYVEQYKDNETLADIQWSKDLYAMEKGFAAALELSEGEYDQKDYEKLMNTFEEGAILFLDSYFDLWD